MPSKRLKLDYRGLKERVRTLTTFADSLAREYNKVLDDHKRMKAAYEPAHRLVEPVTDPATISKVTKGR
jgi:hypothetical protein